MSVLFVTGQSKRTDTMWTISFVYENSNNQEQFFGDCINEIESGAVQKDKSGADQENYSHNGKAYHRLAEQNLPQAGSMDIYHYVSCKKDSDIFSLRTVTFVN